MTIHCIVIVALLVFGLIPLDESRLRAPWAKLLFLVVAISGVATIAFHVAIKDLGLFTPGEDSRRTILVISSAVNGAILGLVFSLIVSGQLLGKKRT